MKRHSRTFLVWAIGFFSIGSLFGEDNATTGITFRGLAMLRTDQEQLAEPRAQTASHTAQNPAASAKSPVRAPPKKRESAPRPQLPRGRVISLEQACDLALASDQAIRNAVVTLRTARLEPWSALTRLGPRITGNLNYEVIREQRYYDSSSSFGSPLATTADTAPLTTSSDPEAAGSQVSRDPTPGVAGSAFPNFDGTHNYTRRASVVIQQPLLDLTVFPAWRFGKLSVATAQLRRQYIIRETLFGVARAYYAVLKAQAVVEVNRETLALAGDQVEVARQRVELGDAARSDELRAQSVLQAARRTLITTQGLLELNRNTLANILNLPWETPFSVTEPAEAPPLSEDYLAILSGAFQRREDFRASSFGIDQRVEKRKEVAASYAPRIVAQAEHDWTDVTTNTSNLDGQRFWSAVVAVQVPIFTGGQREIDLRRTSDAIEQARIDHETLAKSIQSEVKQAWLDVATLRESITALEAEAKAVASAYEDLTSSYSQGNATSLDVAAGLRDRNNARATLSATRYDYQIALRNIQRADGTFESTRLNRTRQQPR